MENPKATIIFEGREVFLEWVESDFFPGDIKISQVVGYCLDDNNRILIVRDEGGWGFTGGHPEPGESPEETLRREVAEEACVSLGEPKFIGYLEVMDPKNELGDTHYIQLRYMADIKTVSDFKKEFETFERKFVDIGSLPQYISWINSPTGRGQMDTLAKFLK